MRPRTRRLNPYLRPALDTTGPEVEAKMVANLASGIARELRSSRSPRIQERRSDMAVLPGLSASISLNSAQFEEGNVGQPQR